MARQIGAAVSQTPANDTEATNPSQDASKGVDGEVEAAHDGAQPDAPAATTGPNVEAIVKEEQVGLSIGPGQSVKLTLVADEESPAPLVEEKKSVHPQASMTKFWDNFNPEYKGSVYQVLPESLVKRSCAKDDAASPQTSLKVAKSYEEAKADCIRTVKRIIKECQELNMKYSDHHFDIEHDLKISCKRDCLDGLVPDPDDSVNPGNVKRVSDIFEDPRFFENGATSDDITQGSSGDCWFLSALSALCSNEDLIRRICVIQSQAAGVYGFVFHRDGEWQQTIIDDKLYLRAPAYDESGDQILTSYNLSRRNDEEEYTRLFQTGSQALIFARSADPNETWVPLLEKAFAKAHGDYAAIEGGQTGEAIEDLTGGVTSEIYTTNILSKDAFWTDELSKVGKDFLFSCGLALYKNWLTRGDDTDNANYARVVQEQRQSGLMSGHAYAVLATYEGFDKRLVKVRNPWGHSEWTGPWSDGSKEWTEGDGDWAKRLNHKFGDDGVFWMSYKDFLAKYTYIDRTRIFGPEWHIANQWTSIQVPWSTADYHPTQWKIEVPGSTEAVIVLSQLDNRYFRGLEGQYNFKFQFRVQKDGEDLDDYLARSRHNYELVRSVNIECTLEPGTYTVLMKVEATENGSDPVETVIRNSIQRREKVIQVGMSYDLAHAAVWVPTPEETTDPAPPPDSAPSDPDDPARQPWNAATVVGLKVYSKQPELSIKVIDTEKERAAEKAKKAEEVKKAEEAKKEEESKTGAEPKKDGEEKEGEEDKKETVEKKDTMNATLDNDDASKAEFDQVTKDKDPEAPAEAATPISDQPIRVDIPADVAA